ncbi:MAG: hypothetical protein ACREPA_06385 [Candidatus Dormibacteraceae bacterium]
MRRGASLRLLLRRTARLGPRLPGRPPVGRLLALCLVSALLFGTLAAAGPAPVPMVPRPPLVGFSFSPQAALYLGEDPDRTLTTLLVRLRPDLVRLPVYWSDVAPTPDGFDFAEVDRMLALIRGFDSRHHAHTRAVLVVGARNIDYPELHVPGWMPIDPTLRMPSLLRSAAYRAYLRTVVLRYAADPLLDAWQIENEPLDDVAGPGIDAAVSVSTMASEIRLAKSADPAHPVVVTTYNSAGLNLDQRQLSPLSGLYSILPGPHAVGHPLPALTLGDVLGLDVYVVTPTTPLSDASARKRIHWKQSTLAFWAEQARLQGKQLWITEMQSSPWVTGAGFTINDLYYSAQEYRAEGASVVLLWGVEQWVQDPIWMRAGQRAFRLLREG